MGVERCGGVLEGGLDVGVAEKGLEGSMTQMLVPFDLIERKQGFLIDSSQ
jgi:hypothetical protein